MSHRRADDTDLPRDGESRRWSRGAPSGLDRVLLACGMGVLLGALLPWYEVEGRTRSGLALRGSPALVTGTLGAVLVLLALHPSRRVWRTGSAAATGGAVMAIAAPWAFRTDGVWVHPQIASDAFDAVAAGLQLTVLAGAVAFVVGIMSLHASGGHGLTGAIVASSLVADTAVAISVAGERVFCGNAQFVGRILVWTAPLALAALWRVRTTEAGHRGLASALAAAVLLGPLVALLLVLSLPTGICGD